MKNQWFLPLASALLGFCLFQSWSQPLPVAAEEPVGQPASEAPVAPVLATPGTQSTSAPVSTTAVFRKDDGRGGPGAAVAEFHPDDRVQHFEVGVRGLSDGSIIRWDFAALETAVGSRPSLASVERSAPALQGASEVILNGKVSLPRDWPLGRYRATVSANGLVLRMLDYVVSPQPTPTPTPPEISAISLARDDGKGKPGQVVSQFVAADRRMHFKADLAAAFTGNARWKFTAIATAAGSNVQLLELNGDVTAVNTLAAQMSAPRDWPIGQYRAEVFLNGSLAKSFEFVVSNN